MKHAPQAGKSKLYVIFLYVSFCYVSICFVRKEKSDITKNDI